MYTPVSRNATVNVGVVVGVTRPLFSEWRSCMQTDVMYHMIHRYVLLSADISKVPMYANQMFLASHVVHSSQAPLIDLSP